MLREGERGSTLGCLIDPKLNPSGNDDCNINNRRLFPYDRGGVQGLLTIAQLLRASSDKWWKGSKIKLLEIVNDGMGIPLEKW